MNVEAPRLYIGVCVRRGAAAIAALGPWGLKITTLRLDRRAPEERPKALQSAVRALVHDVHRTTVVAEPNNPVLRGLQGHVRGLLSLSIAAAKIRLLGEPAHIAHRTLYRQILNSFPQLQGQVVVLPGSGRIAVAERRNTAAPLAVALALAARRIAEFPVNHSTTT